LECRIVHLLEFGKDLRFLGYNSAAQKRFTRMWKVILSERL
jgi:hypothetical protein